MRLACILLLFVTSIVPAAPNVTLLVRHAEKAAEPADDPPPTIAGKRRAEELDRVVRAWSAAGSPVRALFSSEVVPTQKTLAPLAADTRIKVTVIAAKDTASLVKQVLAVNGGIAVVASHSNRLPAIIEALGGPAGLAIPDAEYDDLFVIHGKSFVRLRYGVPSQPFKDAVPSDMRPIR